MHPNQFRVDEAWIVFKLNNEPIHTDRDGLFNIICLMDAASCFLLAQTFVPIKEQEPSKAEFLALLEKGWAHHQEFPTKLFVPISQFPTNVPEVAETQGISVTRVKESELKVFIGEARQFFKEYQARQSARYN